LLIERRVSYPDADAPSPRSATVPLNRSDREYTKKQYRGGPSGGSSITQNQNTFLYGDELSKPNKKYSIATMVIAAPHTPSSTSSLKVGRTYSGISPARGMAINIKSNASERPAEMR
jgi:hypothetical protein